MSTGPKREPSNWVLVMAGRAERHAQERGYQRIIRLLLWLVILPALFLSSVGVLLLLRGEVGNILLGVLVLIFCVTLATGTILAFIDSDCVAQPDWLRRLCDTIEAGAEICTEVS